MLRTTLVNRNFTRYTYIQVVGDIFVYQQPYKNVYNVISEKDNPHWRRVVLQSPKDNPHNNHDYLNKK